MSDLNEFTLNLLTNNEVLAVNQDPLVSPAEKMIVENGQIWTKKLNDGSYAVGFFHVDPYFILWNQDEGDAIQMRNYHFKIDIRQLGFDGKVKVRDLWRKKDIGNVSDYFETFVPYHGITFVTMTPYD